jgi:hypothetical protein
MGAAENGNDAFDSDEGESSDGDGENDVGNVELNDDTDEEDEVETEEGTHAWKLDTAKLYTQQSIAPVYNNSMGGTDENDQRLAYYRKHHNKSNKM